MRKKRCSNSRGIVPNDVFGKEFSLVFEFSREKNEGERKLVEEMKNLL
jgi:hypothetical protein